MKEGQKMKKIISLILTVVMMLWLASCGEFSIFGEVAGEGDVTVVVENADGSFEVYKTYLESVENKEEGAKGVLEHLNQRSDGLYLVMQDGTYGAFVTEIGSIKQADGAYVIVYTSVEADSYVGAPTVEYDGKTLYQSGVGISGMTVNAGTVILFRVESY